MNYIRWQRIPLETLCTDTVLWWHVDPHGVSQQVRDTWYATTPDRPYAETVEAEDV